MREQGFQRLSVWVPGSRKEEFDRAILRLQKKWEADNLFPT